MADVSADGGAHPAIALNRADYKGWLIDAIREHAAGLAARERAIAECRASLAEAARRHRSLAAVLARRHDEIAHARESKARKRHDDLATQAWLRRRAEAGRFHER
ncbi:hypothetical protein WL21_04795 [Burkholderia ubonensis]|nr:hypothetical protein WJ81_15765 [Burkholderia ubonensis]KVZ57318.1 hypothetical protein WL20_23550 [Burkholderia ubonensis]KVZ73015.1 hypothetical protein WL21_04795 [Burkholderia ubonensis]